MTPITTYPAISAPIKLDGEAGDDTLNGGGANDILTGGTGRDMFLRANQISQGVDAITDFEVSATTGDFIDISDLLVAAARTSHRNSALSDFVRAVSNGNGIHSCKWMRTAARTASCTVFVLQGVKSTPRLSFADRTRRYRASEPSRGRRQALRLRGNYAIVSRALDAGGISISPAGSWRRRRCRAAAGLRTA